MPVRELQASVSGVSQIHSLTINEGYGQATVYAEVVASEHDLQIGDTVSEISMGVIGDTAVMISDGIVKNIRARRSEQNYMISIHDGLIRAVDYFIASDSPTAPFEASNISAEALVGQLLAMAGLTNYDGGYATGFTFGVPKPVPINLVSVWDYLENIARITGAVIYMDNSGQVRYAQRKPYIVGGDVSEFTITTGDSGSLLQIDYQRSDEKLRNNVVVYGPAGANIAAVRTGSSPFLPAGFLKTMVIAHELIDTQAMAERTAEINLEMFNRLTETVTVSVLGKPTLRARDIVRVTANTIIGLIDQDFVVYHARHTLDRSGYATELTLVR